MARTGNPSNREAPARLYKEVARMLVAELIDGQFAIGDRLPAERELAMRYNVSRPTIREALIALEVQGFIEVRLGSGIYVRAQSGPGSTPQFDISAIELTEARLLIEAETAALAATQIGEDEIAELEALIDQIAEENLDPAGSEQADGNFHRAIASATRNNALIDAVDRLWDMRSRSPEAALLHEKARTANVKPVVDEHTAILDALRAHDPAAAREAMRAHLTQVLDSLLFATEQRAVEAARKSVRDRRALHSRLTA